MARQAGAAALIDLEPVARYRWGAVGAWCVGLALDVAVAGAAVPPRPADLEALDPMVGARLGAVWQAVVDDPATAAGWLELGRLYHAHQMTEMAIECYLEAARLRPEDAQPVYSVALARAELGLLDEALADLAAVVRLAPAYPPAHWRSGRWLVELGREREAEAAFRRALEVDPLNAAGQVGLARILLDRGEPREAIERLQRVLVSDPTNGVAGQLLGTALRAVGDEVGARRALGLATGMGAYFADPWEEEILGRATGVGNRLRLASARMRRGELDGAMEELQRLRRDHPRDVGVLNKLSEGYLLRGDGGAALEVLRAALEIAPEEFATLIHLAEAERARGDLQSALGWADRAVEANPRFWQAHFTRAGLLHRLARYRECVEALATAMRHGAHQNPNAWLMKGDAHVRVGQWDEAGRAFEHAAERFPFLGQAFVGLALVRAEQGRVAEARAALASARQLQPEDETMAGVEARLLALEAAPQGEGGAD